VPDPPAAAARSLADVAARLFGLSLASVESRSRLVPVQRYVSISTEGKTCSGRTGGCGLCEAKARR
jgi:hypothetical protein